MIKKFKLEKNESFSIINSENEIRNKLILESNLKLYQNL